MTAGQASKCNCVGFLSVVEDQEQGWIGGYLVLDFSSRPLEFHCTAPVQPNKAQAILYGPTLRPYLCGDQIGATLIGKSQNQPNAIFTDVRDAMAARALVAAPMAYVQPQVENTSAGTASVSGKSIRIDPANPDTPAGHATRLEAFTLSEQSLSVSDAFPTDKNAFAQLNEVAVGLDLLEPFQRIREAIEETQLRKR